jgi:hypothetical protein
MSLAVYNLTTNECEAEVFSQSQVRVFSSNLLVLNSTAKTEVCELKHSIRREEFIMPSPPTL